jgi:hypothetical protein
MDIERCVGGGQVKIMGPIEEPVVIVRILTHLNLPVLGPPRAVAQELSLNHAACPKRTTSVLWRIDWPAREPYGSQRTCYIGRKVGEQPASGD